MDRSLDEILAERQSVRIPLQILSHPSRSAAVRMILTSRRLIGGAVAVATTIVATIEAVTIEDVATDRNTHEMALER